MLRASPYSASGKDINLIPNFLDVKNRDNVNITVVFLVRVLFCRASSYKLKLTDGALPQEFPVNWVIPEHDPQGSEVCAEPR